MPAVKLERVEYNGGTGVIDNLYPGDSMDRCIVMHDNKDYPVVVSLSGDGKLLSVKLQDNICTVKGSFKSAVLHRGYSLTHLLYITLCCGKKDYHYKVVTSSTAAVDFEALAGILPQSKNITATECPICFEENNSRTILVCKGPVYHAGCCEDCAAEHPDQRGLCPTCGTAGTPIVDYIASGKPLPKKGIIRIA
jgi:hypothetical protein